MKKQRHLMRLIWNINGIILCLLFILGIVSLGVNLINSLIPEDDEAESVSLIERQSGTTSETKKEKPQFHLSNQLAILKDYYIFSITSPALYQTKTSSNNDIYYLPKARGDKGDYLPEVNLLLINSKTLEKQLLFKDNLMILEKHLATFERNTSYETMIFPMNLYLVVSQDTNHDQQLNNQDRKDLYLSEYNGTKLQLLARDIKEFSIIADHQALIISEKSKKKIFQIYNCEEGKLTLLLNQKDLKI